MQPLSAAEIRERFLAFYEERGHARMPSDSLVPSNDPTLLFTGAGMNQFKDMFMGRGKLPHTRVTTSQKCLRVPDLENVGRTPRHHTMFEMLGHFSFGDYFKEECIQWEWEFFRDVMGIPAEQMVVTVYQDDEEAFGIWRDTIGLAEEKIFRFGEKENFWPAEAPSKGPNGPCGPCSEIYFDAQPGEPMPSNEGLHELPEDRFTEIGNCVFTQFERKDGGKLDPLPQRNIDVGLGLERIAAVLAGAANNFETDLFRPYLDHLGKLSGKTYGQDPADDERMRRIADHVRAVTFCIADGAVPGNEGRGYVVRKILRRAIRDGYGLGIEQPFLHGMVDVVGAVMGDAFPEVREHSGQCRSIIRSEEEGFATVYKQGMARLEDYIATPEVEQAKGKGLDSGPLAGSGEFAFQLHDTYGFPVDITGAVLRDHGLLLDEAGFGAAMAAQRERARAAMSTADAVFTANAAMVLREAGVPATEFLGYDRLESDGSVAALVGEGDKLLEAAQSGERVMLVTAQTPFYAQGGGQLGDRGAVHTDTGRGRIVDTTKLDDFHLHTCEVEEGTLRVGDQARLVVDSEWRRATERNHTATHLLHAALREVLGDHVSQAGSEVAPERLRFDYTNPDRPTADQLAEVERLVNREVLRSTEVLPVVKPLEQARSEGFMALFGEKYGDEVRTVTVDGFSKELCGGTHVRTTGEIGPFRIVSESAISAGTRRLEAVTGWGAFAAQDQDRKALETIAAAVKAPLGEAAGKVQELAEELKRLRKELEKARSADLGKVVDQVRAAAVEHDGNRTAVLKVPAMQMKDLQNLMGQVQQALAPVAAVLLSPGDEGVLVGAVVSKPLTKAVQAGAIVKDLCGILGGGGGGRPEMAQGKGRDAGKLAEAEAAAGKLLREAGLQAPG